MLKSVVLQALLGLAISAVGQSNYGVITGTVTDVQHLRVATATIQLKAASTGAVRRVITNEQGLFEAPALLPDDYEITTEAPGFAPATQSVRLEVGQRLAVDVMLKIGPVREE